MANLKKIFESGCLISLSASRWGNFRKIQSELVSIPVANKEWASASKKLISNEALKPINKQYNKAKKKIESHSLPFPIRGVWFIPKELISELDEYLTECKSEFNKEVEKLGEKWDELLQEAEENLDELYNPSQYPVDIRSRFNLEWRFFHFDIPSSKLGILSRHQYEKEVQKMIDTINEAEKMAIIALRTEMLDMLKHAVHKLSDGEAKRLHKSTIGRFHEFFRTFKNRNIFQDDELSEIVELAEEIVGDITIEDVKEDEHLKEEIAEYMEVLHEELENSMIAKPKRSVKIRIRS